MKKIGKTIVAVYFKGVVLLIGAIVLNVVADVLNFDSWYNVLTGSYELNILNAVWLFFVYPFSLGLIVYILKK